jgi:flagellar assembly protein FliH
MSRIIIDKNDEDTCARWTIPELSVTDTRAGTGVYGATGGLMTVGQAELIRRQAYEEGFDLGRREGQAAGEQELKEQCRRFEQLMQTLTQPFETLDQEVEEGLVALAVAIARHLVRREITTDPNQIVAVVKEAVGSLPCASRMVRLHLHPDDARIIHERVHVPDGENRWQVHEDPSLTRGGCLVVTETSRIDARVETRLNKVIAAVMSGEREGELPR